MSKHKTENVHFTNMVMIYDEATEKVLVQVRKKNDWDGISFPGGHTEKGEPFLPSAIREIKEETGLDIKNLVPCGYKDWYDYELEERYVVLFYYTKTFTGNLIEECEEGINRWMTIKAIHETETALDFTEMLNIFTGESRYKEFFYEDTKDINPEKRWVKRFY